MIVDYCTEVCAVVMVSLYVGNPDWPDHGGLASQWCCRSNLFSPIWILVHHYWISAQHYWMLVLGCDYFFTANNLSAV